MARTKAKVVPLETEVQRVLGTQERWRACQSLARDIYHSELSRQELSVFIIQVRNALDPAIGGNWLEAYPDEPIGEIQ